MLLWIYAEDRPLFFNGIKLETVPLGPKVDRNPVESGSQSFTPARDAELMKEHVTGSQLAVHQSSSSSAPAPMRELQRFHTEETWWMTLNTFMNVVIAEQIDQLPMYQHRNSQNIYHNVASSCTVLLRLSHQHMIP